ncbi:MAG: amino acid ABC transporter permease [Clostridiales bacterium]|nr:amino acid ABC transporter permease [Clostridiales bacterium]
MDFVLIMKLIPIYKESIFLTLKLSLCAIMISLFLGIVCSAISYMKIPIVSWIIKFYVEISRNTPLTIQLFFLYFSLPLFGVRLSSFNCALFGLSFLGGSYMCEAVKGGFDSIKKTQIESGLSIGLNNWQLICHIILPQAIVLSMPLIAGVIVFLIKETSVAGIVALADVMFVTKDVIGMYYCTNEALFMLIVSYVVIILPFVLLFTFLKEKIKYIDNKILF